MSNTASQDHAANQVLRAQAEYVKKIVEGLAPTIQKLMNEIPPPELSTANCAGGFLQALAELQLSVTVACKVHPLELVRCLRLLADDIEQAILAVPSDELTATLVKKREPESEFKVDF